MRIRSKKIWSVLLAAALSFTLATPSVYAEPDAEEDSTNTESDGNPVSLGGWGIRDDAKDNSNFINEESDEEGDSFSYFTIFNTSGKLEKINATITGSTDSDDLEFFFNDEVTYKINENDKITLNVSCGKDKDSVDVDFPIKFLQKEDNSEEFRKKVFKVITDENTVCRPFLCAYNIGDDEEVDENTEYAWRFRFYNKEDLKTESIGGWTVSDKYIEGSESEFIKGYKSGSHENLCKVDLVSPASENDAIDTTLKGSTDSMDLTLYVEEYLSENYQNYDYRGLKDGDNILINVTKPDGAKAGDSVSVRIEKDNFDSETTDVSKIVKIKADSGIEYKIFDEEEVKEADDDEDDDEDVDIESEKTEYWVFEFKVVEENEQKKRESVASEDRKAESGSKSERTQVLGDTIKMIGEKQGKKKIFSISGLKNLKGIQKLTVNAGAKFNAEDLKGLDIGTVTISFNASGSSPTNGSPKDVKRLFKLNKKGRVTVRVDKSHASYTLMIPVNECTLCLTVVNVNFDKNAIKDKKITALQGEGSSVSVNLMQFVGKSVQSDESEFLSADWFVDGNTEVTTVSSANPDKSKNGFNVYLSPDYRTLTVVNPGNIKEGSVKITAAINGKKYSVTVKAKVN